MFKPLNTFMHMHPFSSLHKCIAWPKPKKEVGFISQNETFSISFARRGEGTKNLEKSPKLHGYQDVKPMQNDTCLGITYFLQESEQIFFSECRNNLLVS